MSDTWISRIRQWMDMSGTSQGTLASALECTRGAVGHYLAGRRQPTLTQLERIANAMQVHPAWLLYGIGMEQIAEEWAVYRTDRYPPNTLPLFSAGAEHCNDKPIVNLDLKPLGERCYGILMEVATPRSSAGEILIVDPAAAAHPGDEILVGFAEGSSALSELVSESSGEIVLIDLIDPRVRKTVSNTEILFMHRVIGVVRKGCLAPREPTEERL